MVCPLLSNGLVQLVCEDGGIVSFLILPQPRPFMRQVRIFRECDGFLLVILLDLLLGADVDDVVALLQGNAVPEQRRVVARVISPLREQNRRPLVDSM